jgi:hypothetical protein
MGYRDNANKHPGTLQLVIRRCKADGRWTQVGQRYCTEGKCVKLHKLRLEWPWCAINCSMQKPVHHLILNTGEKHVRRRWRILEYAYIVSVNLGWNTCTSNLVNPQAKVLILIVINPASIEVVIFSYFIILSSGHFTSCCHLKEDWCLLHKFEFLHLVISLMDYLWLPSQWKNKELIGNLEIHLFAAVGS